MRVNFNWLRDYVDLDGVSPKDLGDRLTMVGLEVDMLADRYAYLGSVVAARVEEVADHPKSDHLKVCRVVTGSETFQVVCGAPNARAGMISALAKPGSVLPGGRAVGEAEMRGILSQGMLCSEAELMLGDDASGIMDLPESTTVGLGLKEALGLDDWVFEIGITPNRPDCLCVLGIAREVAGLFGRKLTYPKVELVESDEKIEDVTSVDILDPEHCPRYTARVIKGVKIGPSPFWLKERLTAAGVRPISNIVDITNFVMLEIGQPLHAFDLHRLEEERIVVRTAGEGDRFTTLDGVERIMTPEMLMICDGRKPVGLAGVMGGLNSEIVDDTEDILLESAYFSPTGIRRTSKTLGLSTEASYRFERGADPEVCAVASARASALMAELAGGKVAKGVIDANPIPSKRAVVPFSPAKCNAFLGTDFSVREMKDALSGIELEVLGDGDSLEIRIPTFRVDLEREVDIFEEVARLCGFDRVPTTVPEATGEPVLPDPSRLLRAKARDILEGRGLNEMVGYSFISENFPERLGLAGDDRRRDAVRIINPLSEEQVLMRTTFVPSLLDALRRNLSYGVKDVALYEVGKVYFAVAGQELAEERWTIGGLIAGGRRPASWHWKDDEVDFYDAKGIVEDLLDGLNSAEPVFETVTDQPFLNPRAAARVSVNGNFLGLVGKVSTPVLKAFDAKEAAYVFELDVAALLAARQAPQFRALPRFPAVERDMAVVVAREVEAAGVFRFIRGLGEELIEDVMVFDAYEGAQVGEGRRSLGFRIVYRSADHTLTDEEVNQVHQRATDRVLAKFGAELRT
jgi:phenylalanyl-tRNA synthetase beta chain